MVKQNIEKILQSIKKTSYGTGEFKVVEPGNIRTNATTPNYQATLKEVEEMNSVLETLHRTILSQLQPYSQANSVLPSNYNNSNNVVDENFIKAVKQSALDSPQFKDQLKLINKVHHLKSKLSFAGLLLKRMSREKNKLLKLSNQQQFIIKKLSASVGNVRTIPSKSESNMNVKVSSELSDRKIINDENSLVEDESSVKNSNQSVGNNPPLRSMNESEAHDFLDEIWQMLDEDEENNIFNDTKAKDEADDNVKNMFSPDWMLNSSKKYIHMRQPRIKHETVPHKLPKTDKTEKEVKTGGSFSKPITSSVNKGQLLDMKRMLYKDANLTK
ncbi:hypothetical protein HELRODRAFT_162469 [Helobdella robusta]|uniref:Uncharacterized protein n=1 Tax=Helobdella robusta TaxID=6412 RepID=T1ESQ0_HELRO|nr:hypothetical protein HELRODRAFT_162469 [Helobdella robusta]ESN98994.1 hypothetical protein HELRODRAFT_162469 [Helobdella robusta]